MGAVDFDLTNAARRVVEGALGVAAGEQLAVVVDAARRDLGAALADVARGVGATPRVVELELVGARPLKYAPSALVEALVSSQASLLLVGFEEGEIGMRQDVVDLVKRCSLRHAHMVGVTRRSLIGGFSVDPARILDATRAVRMRIRPDSILHLRTRAGSDLDVRLGSDRRWVEHVGVIRPGRWENLPTGEIVTAPASVRGVFVVDASIGAHFGQAAGLLTSRPLRLEIEGGWCRSVRCPDLALQLDVERFFASDPNGGRVGTVSLGTNVGLHAPLGDILCDQNLPGLHLGFGSPYPELTGATWDARIQVTMTCAEADVDLDGAPLLRRGRYLTS